MMVNAGLITFKKIEETNPREIEMIVNRHPPFGSQIREAASSMPKYELSVQQTGRHQPNRAEIVITLTMTNYIKRRDVIGSGRNSHFCLVLVSDADNKVVFKQRLSDAVFRMKEGCWSKRVDVQRAAAKSSELNIHLISQEYVGLDVSKVFSPHYTGVVPYIIMKREPPANTPKNVKRIAPSSETTSGTPRVPCSHRCLNKEVCGHECCKQGVVSKAKKKCPEMEQNQEPNCLPSKSTPTKDVVRKNTEERSNMNMFLKNLHQRTRAIPGTPAKRLKMSGQETGEKNFVDLTLDERFGYSRKTPFHHQVDTAGVKIENVDSVKKKEPGESSWDEINWHQRQMEKYQDMGEDFEDDDHFADELPCFSVDELWNDDELSLMLNDDSDSFASPPDQNSWERMKNSSHSRYSAAERHQSNSNVKCQNLKSKTSDKVNKQPPPSSQFITRPKAKVPNNASFSVGHMYSQPKENPRRISHPLPPPPPTPGADDFEMTGLGRSARSAYNENWNEEQFTNGTTERIAHRQNWSTLTHDPLPDGLEKEDLDVLPVFTNPRQRRNSSNLNQQSSKNLQSMLSSTTLEPLVLKETICLEEESVPKIEEDFSTNRCEESPISSSFFCSKSFKSCEKDHEEQDAFAGIFNGLL